MIELTHYRTTRHRPDGANERVEQFEVSAHGDGFIVSKPELMDFVVRAAAELGLPSLSCVDCHRVPYFKTVPDVPQDGVHLVCKRHRKAWDADQPQDLKPIEWVALL